MFRLGRAAPVAAHNAMKESGMPELPEVETVRRGLMPHLPGHVLTRVEVRRPDLRWPLPPDLVQVLTGARVVGLRRRSKYLLADLDRGPGLLIHLGMSGRLLIELPGDAAARDSAVLARHDHVVLETDAGTRIIYNDARRFGMVDLLREGEKHRLLAGLGPEPGDFPAPGEVAAGLPGPDLAAAFSGRRAPVKALLLDQRIIAGLGNIYVSEALFRARIDPRRPGGDIPAPQLAALMDEIRNVLSEAIAAGGSSLRDHRQVGGELGYFQHSFRVYGREGQPCPTPGCTGTIARIVQSGRSSFFCPLCQH